MTENEESGLSAEPSPTDSSPSSSGSIQSKSMNNTFVCSLRKENDCAAVRSHNEDHTTNWLENLGLLFHNTSWKGFFKEV